MLTRSYACTRVFVCAWIRRKLAAIVARWCMYVRGGVHERGVCSSFCTALGVRTTSLDSYFWMCVDEQGITCSLDSLCRRVLHEHGVCSQSFLRVSACVCTCACAYIKHMPTLFHANQCVHIAWTRLMLKLSFLPGDECICICVYMSMNDGLFFEAVHMRT